MLNIIKNTINRVFASGVDSDASAFITATGLSGTTQKSAITTLVKDLKASGLWSKMKAVYPMVTDNYNLLSYTEDFSNAAWSKSSATVVSNSIIAPNGTLTADSFNDGASNNYHQVYTQINSLPIGTYTFSFYLKSNTNTKNIAIYPFGTATPGGTGTGGVILTQNGAFVANASGGVVSYGSQDVGNGWRRFYVVGTSIAISNVYPVIAFADGTNVIYTGSNTDAYIWGAQYELGSTPSTYQPILTTPSAFMASQMKYNLKDARDLDAAFRLTWSGGWTYSATGATPNGTNAYADTKLNALSNLTLANSHFSYYSRTNVQNDAFHGLTASGANNGLQLLLRGTYYTDQIQAIIGDTNASNIIQVANTNSTGLFTINRNSISNANLFKNNSKIGSTTYTISGNYVNNTIYLASRNSGGSPNSYDSRQVSFSTIGNGLSDQDSFLLNQIVEKYQVALSRGVQAAQSFYYNSAYSNEANTYLYSTQITGTTQVNAINTLINGLKANNLWAKMKAVYPFVTDKWNMFGYTEDFTNAVWGKSSVTATLTGTYNNSNYFKIADSVNGNSAFLFYYSGIATTSNTYTVSANFKKGEYDYVQIHPSGSNGAVFNLANGTIVSNSVTNATITDIGNGWYKCTITYTASGGNIHFSPNKTSTSTYSYSGTIGYGIYMQSPQFEVGTIVSTYQPVLGANNYSTNVAAQMKFNLVNPQDSDAAFRLAFSGGWTYSTNGAQPNGTNGYADTKFSPSANLTANSSHLSLYSRTAIGNLPQSDMGSYTVAATDAFTLAIAYSNVCYMGSAGFGAAVNYIDFANTDSRGYYVNTRTSSTLLKGFKNNTIGDTSTTSVSGVLPTLNTTIGAENVNGVPTSYSTKQYAFATIGTGLSDAEVALLTQLVQDFQTTLSRQV